MINYLSLDFESWAYPDIPEFKKLSSRERKSLDNEYVKYSAEKILLLLDKYKTKITFFILGELYEWYPKTIWEIKKEGHEIAYHTHRHDILYSEKVLIDSLENSKQLLKDFSPKGFRAPEIIIKENDLKTLKKFGFAYDSSVYGTYNLKSEVKGITEIPISTYPIIEKPQKLTFPKKLTPKLLFSEPPIGSGYFIALLGKIIKPAFQKINEKGLPFVAFMHNWQVIRPKKSSFPPKGYFLTHPTYLPYMRDCYNIFEYLLENFELGRMENIL